MEPVTHALSGAVLAAVCPRNRISRWLPVWGALVAASPDVDVFFIHTPLEYIVYHRGITHSFVGALVFALFWAMMLILLRRRLALNDPLPSWSFPALFGLSYLLLLHHIWLDCMNSYGTQVFLPFSTYRVRWNALFIVDPLLLIPLALGVLLIPVWNRRGITRKVMSALLIWTILYPLGALGLRLSAESHLREQIQHTTTPAVFQQTTTHPLIPEQRGDVVWGDVHGVSLVPDAFTPFYWKLILEREAVLDVAGYWVFSSLPTHYTAYARPPAALWERLGHEDRIFSEYQAFAVFPAWEQLVQTPASEEYIFTDLRFGSTLETVNDIQSFYTNKKESFPLPFRIMARVSQTGTLEAVRFVTTSGAGGDSGWIPPVLP